MSSLKEKALKGVKWTTFSSVVAAISQLLQVIVLARFLSPKEFGLVAISLVVIGFSQMFLDMGVSNAIIHKQEIDKKELDSLYGLNIISGLFIFSILYFVAPFFSWFYHEKELTSIIRWTSLAFLIQPFGQQFIIILKKELQFNEIAKVDVVSKSLSFLISVALAFYGFGVYSLVFSSLIAVLASTFFLILIGLKYHRPSFYFKFSAIEAGTFKFGFFQMGENFINYFNTQFDSILIGKLLGVDSLGIYNIAKNLAMRPAQIINPIVTQLGFPVMAKLQNDTIKLKETYLKIIRYLSTVNFPIYFFIAIFADQFILTLFDTSWIEASLILRILAIFWMLRSIGNPVGGLLLAKGRADLGFYWNFSLFLLIPLSIYIGSYWGLKGIALTLLVLQLALLIPGWKILIEKCCNASFREYFSSFQIPLFIASIQGVLFIIIIFSIDGIVFQLSIGFIIMVVSNLFLNKLLNRRLYKEAMEYLKFIKLKVN